MISFSGRADGSTAKRLPSSEITLNGDLSMSETVDRRDFVKTGVAAGAALSFTDARYDRVDGADECLPVGFLGVGGRCQQHVDVVLKMVEEKKAVRPVAACDVWDGDPTKGKGKGQGLYPTAKRCGINQDDKD